MDSTTTSQGSQHPEKHSPPPPGQELHVVLVDGILATLEFGTEPPKSSGDGPAHPQEYLVLEYVEDCEEGNSSQGSLSRKGALDTGNHGLAFPHCILGVVGRLFLARRPAEDDPYRRNKGGSAGRRLRMWATRRNKHLAPEMIWDWSPRRRHIQQARRKKRQQGSRNKRLTRRYP